jgi:hypothetical protein
MTTSSSTRRNKTMKSHRIPMPSPSGRNAENLFLPSAGGFALDAAPEPKPRLTKQQFDRLYDHVVERFGQEMGDALWGGMTGPAYEAEQAEDDTPRDLDVSNPESADYQRHVLGKTPDGKIIGLDDRF